MEIDEVVQRVIGDLSEITREQMAAILVALDMDPDCSTITGRSRDGRLLIKAQPGGGGGSSEVVPRVRTGPASAPPSRRAVDWAATRRAEQEAVARGWANVCRDSTCVSVYGDTVRYDEPGSMHPEQYAPVMFVPAELAGLGHDQIGQMRARAGRLLVVSSGGAGK